MFKFKECDDDKPVVIKKECSDAEYVYVNITNRPKNEDIPSIKCEEIDIKEELDDEAGISKYHKKDYDSFENDASSNRKSDSEGKSHSCPTYSHSPNRNAGIKKHTRSHWDNEEHKCLLCTFVADNRLSLKAHLTSHKGHTKKFGCHKCPYETDITHSLTRHSLKHKDMLEVETYKCPLCPYVSKYKSVMRTHQKLQHNENIKMYKCEECSFSTKYSNCLAEHQLVHVDPKMVNKFKCEKCPYQGKRQHYLTRHMKTHSEKLQCRAETGESDHKKDDDVFENDASSNRKNYSEGKRYFCPKCSHSSNRNSNIRKHMRSHSDNEQHKCILCIFIADSRLSLKAHWTSHKGRTKEFGCHKCPYETNFKRNLVRHSLKHKNVFESEMYKCPLCPYASKYKSVMLAHRRLQHDRNTKMYKCEKCSFSTKYKVSLEVHQFVHVDSKVVNKFKCEKCPYQSKKQYEMNRHMKTHSKELQYCESEMYECKLCTYKTKTITAFKAHMTKYHPDPSSVLNRCAYCPYKTAVRRLLLKHVDRRHSRVDHPMLKCALCSYTTTEKKQMRSHSFVHQEATFQCDNCHFEAEYKQNLKVYMYGRHSSKRFKFKCPKCECYTNKSALNKQWVVKLEPTIVYHCATCDFKAKDKDSLTGHIESCLKGNQEGNEASLMDM